MLLTGSAYSGPCNILVVLLQATETSVRHFIKLKRNQRGGKC